MNKLILFLLGLSLFYSACQKSYPVKKTSAPESISAKSVQDTSVVLKINEKQYTNKDFRTFLDMYHSEILKTEIKNDRLLSRLFDTFVEQKMISFMVDQENISVSDEDYSNYISQNNVGESNFNNETILSSIKLQKYLYDKIYKDINITDEEIRKYFNANPHKFIKRDEIELYQILVEKKEKAEKIREELEKSPQKFEEYARNESISPEAKNNGLMGFFERGNLPIEIENIVFSAKLNEITQIFESSFGFHIFKVTKKNNRKKLYLTTVKEDIKKTLMAEKMNLAYLEFINKLNTDLNILPIYDKLFFKYQKVENEEKNEKLD